MSPQQRYTHKNIHKRMKFYANAREVDVVVLCWSRSNNLLQQIVYIQSFWNGNEQRYLADHIGKEKTKHERVHLTFKQQCLLHLFSPLRNTPMLPTSRIYFKPLHCQLFSSPNIIMKNLIYIWRVIKSRRLKQAGHIARMEEDRSAFKMLTGKYTRKRPLGRPRRR